MKGKITMTISIGCTALILTMVMFTQFKTVEQTDITAIETMRETELRAGLSSWKTKYEEIETKLEAVESKINEYETQLLSDEDSSKLLENEIGEAEKYLGYTDVQGEGIVVLLQDNEFKNIESYDLLQLVNELKLSGAEAISINDERVVSTTDIVLINNRIILVNSRRISGPYTVKAIGDKKYLESAITIKGGYIDEITAAEKTISYNIEENISIKKYEGTMELNYSKINE